MTTKKNKEQFEKWYLKNYENRKEVPIEIGVFAEMAMNNFYSKPLSMQWGVYLEYYDSNPYKFSTNWLFDCYWQRGLSRSEAQKKTLEKMDELMNEKLNFRSTKES